MTDRDTAQMIRMLEDRIRALEIAAGAPQRASDGGTGGGNAVWVNYAGE